MFHQQVLETAMLMKMQKIPFLMFACLSVIVEDFECVSDAISFEEDRLCTF